MPVKSPKPVPEGMSTVTTQLFYNGNCKEAIEFYKKAFNATLIGKIAFAPDGSVMHAMMRFGNTNLMMSDSLTDGYGSGSSGRVNASLFMYVENCDALYNQAVSAGCKVIHEMTDVFWGDRMGNILDPFGQYWAIASYKWILTPEEVAKGQQEWIESLEK